MTFKLGRLIASADCYTPSDGDRTSEFQLPWAVLETALKYGTKKDEETAGRNSI